MATKPQLESWIGNLLRPRGRALLSGGYQYLRIRKGIEGWSLGDVPSRQAVRGEHNHAPKEKVQATGTEGSAERENVSRTSNNMAYYRMP